MSSVRQAASARKTKSWALKPLKNCTVGSISPP
jgi:hypothetical protein